jgi:hypothetical protein
MQDIVTLLARCGVRVKGAHVREYPVRIAASSYPRARDGVERTEIRLELPNGLSFVERVGFRYCVDKQLRAGAAAVYWRTVEAINRQRLWMADRLTELHHAQAGKSFSATRALAAAELEALETPVFPHYSLLEGHDRESCGFPSPTELFGQIGARDWFRSWEHQEDGGRSRHYCVGKDSLALPAFSLEVIDRRSAGRHEVFDLSVDDLHAFVAGSVCVHNCIGNSGPLPEPISAAIKSGGLTVSSVLSGNRNFEGRIHPQVKMNFLASPPLVVAYALAGSIRKDLYKDPLGKDPDGKDVYLKDIWPGSREINDLIAANVNAKMFKQSYSSVFDGDSNWNGLEVPAGETFAWSDDSTYIRNPPYFDGMTLKTGTPADIRDARVLALLGDMVTTDHISPAGNIAADSPAGRYLQSLGVKPADFNSYGARRGNHEVMMRGTFANIRLRNELVPGTEGGWTTHIPSGEKLSIYDGSMRYQQEGTPLIIIAGKEYGAGSSRDWAAKGTALLGVRAVIAESYERIHRSNLIGMGVLPLEFQPGETPASLGLTGRERYTIEGIKAGRFAEVRVTATADDGKSRRFTARVRIDTPKEQEYFVHGGILHYVLRQLATA